MKVYDSVFVIQAFPASIIFAGIGVLLSVSELHGFLAQHILKWDLQAAKDVSSGQDKLIDIFNRIEGFFHRLEIYTSITPTTAMADVIVEIMVEVLTILALATNEVNCRGLSVSMSRRLTFLTDTSL